MLKVYCVIACYNNLKWVDSCLGSLKKSEHPIHIIIVDDASTDGSREFIKKNYPEVQLIESDQNNGFSAANNRGILKAIEQGADYLLLLNMDAWIEPDTVTVLLRIAESNPDYGIISPMHMNGAGTALDYLFSTYLEPKKCPELYSDIYTGNTEEIYPIHSVNAAAWFVRSDIFKKIGLLDESFFMYGSDDNFVDRVKYYGYKVGVTPATNIFHDREHRIPDINNIKTDYQKQINRMKVIAFNPNCTSSDKIFLLFRKSMSDFIRNLKSMNILSALKNINVLIYGVYFSIRHKDRHRELKNQMQLSINA